MRVKSMLFLVPLLIAAAPATAQVPAEVATFNQWVANSGTITYNCPAGWNCSTIAEGNGFLQLSMQQSGSSEAYIRTIVTDIGATLDPTLAPPAFADETVVKMSASIGGASLSDNGILGQQIIHNVTPDGTSFSGNTTIGTGWGLSVMGAAISVDQALTNPGGAGYADDFVNAFNYTAAGDSNGDGIPDGYRMELGQVVGLMQDGTGSSTDVQVFALRELSGSFQPSSGTASLPTGDSLSYTTGDTIKGTWVGQSVDSGGFGGLFGYQSYGVSDPTQSPNPISYFSMFDTGPWGWDSNFGPNPCLVGTDGNPSPSGLGQDGLSDVCP